MAAQHSPVWSQRQAPFGPPSMTRRFLRIMGDFLFAGLRPEAVDTQAFDSDVCFQLAQKQVVKVIVLAILRCLPRQDRHQTGRLGHRTASWNAKIPLVYEPRTRLECKTIPIYHPEQRSRSCFLDVPYRFGVSSQLIFPFASQSRLPVNEVGKGREG